MSNTESNKKEDTWFLRKEFIGVMVALMIQAGSFIIFITQMEGRVAHLESKSRETSAEMLETKQFHVDQRVRLWDRVMKLEKETLDSNANMKALFVHIENLNSGMRRLLDAADRANERARDKQK